MIHAREAGVNIGKDLPTKIKHKLYRPKSDHFDAFLVTSDARKLLAKLIFEIRLQIHGKRSPIDKTSGKINPVIIPF